MAESLSIEKFQSNGRVEFTQKLTTDSALFSRETLPSPLKDTYEKRCSPPPNLSIMDPVSNYPSYLPFFLNGLFLLLVHGRWKESS